MAAQQQWDHEIANELELIFEEWLTNVIGYGLVHSPEPFLKIEITSQKKAARIVVTDNGIPFDPTRHPPPDFSIPPEKRPIGGLGIFMMRKLSDTMHHERVKNLNVLTIEKDLANPVLGRNNVKK